MQPATPAAYRAILLSPNSRRMARWKLTYGEHPTCSLKNNVFVNNNGINSFLIICVSTCWQLVLARNIQQTCVILTYIYSQF